MDCNMEQMFWTSCPFCGLKSTRHRSFTNRSLHCQFCLKPFIAYDLGSHAAPMVPSVGRPFGQHVFPQQKQVPQKTSKGGRTLASEVGGGPKNKSRKRGRKFVVESSESGDIISSTDTREVVVGKSDGSTGGIYFRQDGTKEEAKASTVDPDTRKSSVNDKSESNPELYFCLYPEFSDFDKDQEQKCFAINQVWACYDAIDQMPRFYALVRKVYSPVFKLKITWLDPDPEDQGNMDWVNAELPFACGKFMHGSTIKTANHLAFSHQIRFEKGSQGSYVIYPRTGETWALFKDWDIKWSSNPENHKTYNFEIVEILSDFGDDNGIKVAYLKKVEGFVSLFKRKTHGGISSFFILPSEKLRFSHQIPSCKMTGMERDGVPKGSFELDPSSLPTDLLGTSKKSMDYEGKNDNENESLKVGRSRRELNSPDRKRSQEGPAKHSNGFMSVFSAERSKRSNAGVFEVPRSELARFSHQIPAFQLSGEKDGLLQGCWELEYDSVPDLDIAPKNLENENVEVENVGDAHAQNLDGSLGAEALRGVSKEVLAKSNITGSKVTPPQPKRQKLLKDRVPVNFAKSTSPPPSSDKDKDPAATEEADQPLDTPKLERIPVSWSLRNKMRRAIPEWLSDESTTPRISHSIMDGMDHMTINLGKMVSGLALLNAQVEAMKIAESYSRAAAEAKIESLCTKLEAAEEALKSSKSRAEAIEAERNKLQEGRGLQEEKVRLTEEGAKLAESDLEKQTLARAALESSLPKIKKDAVKLYQDSDEAATERADNFVDGFEALRTKLMADHPDWDLSGYDVISVLAEQ